MTKGGKGMTKGKRHDIRDSDDKRGKVMIKGANA